jgi:hypothetical protein
MRIDLQILGRFDEWKIDSLNIDFVLQLQVVDDMQGSGRAKEGNVVEDGLCCGHGYNGTALGSWQGGVWRR